MTEEIVNDGPDDVCFGCGQRNEHGLRMTFRRLEGWSVEASYEVPSQYNGAPGVVHGGIQAVLLDEVMGMAAHQALSGEDHHIVTAEMKLRYRRPANTLTALTVRGTVVRYEDPNFFIEGQILDTDGKLLTGAEARFRRLA